jgi:hypothetical protein
LIKVKVAASLGAYQITSLLSWSCLDETGFRFSRSRPLSHNRKIVIDPDMTASGIKAAQTTTRERQAFAPPRS